MKNVFYVVRRYWNALRKNSCFKIELSIENEFLNYKNA